MMTDWQTGEVIMLVITVSGLAVVLGQTRFLFQLLRQQGRMLVRVESLESRAHRASATGSSARDASRPARTDRVVPGIGDPAPWIRLPSLDVEPLDIARFRGQAIMLLFWNPGCGSCHAMLEDLRRWDTHKPADAPRLVVVAYGPEEAAADLHLDASVVLDGGFRIGPLFGIKGTPAAVLVDERGHIASRVAAGADAVLRLAGAPARATTVSGR